MRASAQSAHSQNFKAVNTPETDALKKNAKQTWKFAASLELTLYYF